MSEQYEKVVFANNLRRIMESKGIEQRTLAEVVGVSDASVSFWLSADRYPSPGKIQKIADFLGVRKTQLIDERPPVSFEVERVAHKLEQLTPSQLDIVERMVDALLN